MIGENATQNDTDDDTNRDRAQFLHVPTDHMSALSSYGVPSRISGATYPGVPH